MKWFLKCLKQFADFKGRARRKEYGIFQLFLFIFSVVIPCLLFWVAYSSPMGRYKDYLNENFEGQRPPPLLQFVLDLSGFIVCNSVLIGYAVALLLLLPNLAVSVRRLHDVGISGWFVLLLPIPHLFVLLAGFNDGVFRQVMPLGIISFVLSLGIVVMLLIRNSQTETNQYGANPKVGCKG